MNLYCIGTNFNKADASIRGKFSLSRLAQSALLKEAKQQGIQGIFVLSTCNRTEITGFAERSSDIIGLLCKYSKGSIDEFVKISCVLKNEDAVRHLFRLGSGLESQILGDYEIIGQLRNAFKHAKIEGTTNSYFERLLNSVTQASKQVKNETKLSSGTTSVSYAAVQFLKENYPDYNSKNILLFGLGKIGKHTCQNIAEHTSNKRVSLINRSENKLDDIRNKYSFIRKADFKNLVSEVRNTDVLIVSTGSDSPTITSEHISKDKKLIILDLSMPANVSSEVTGMDNVTLANVDILSRITDETLLSRQGEVSRAERILDKHETEFHEWSNYRRLTPALNALKESLHLIKQDEINFHKKKTENFNESQAEIISSRLIQKITSQFAKHLKDENTSVSQSIEVISKVFGIAHEQNN
tara:strand:+ start:134 stop:1369 length:1236 start_codon:yes stop_codon:yes gene_type:complete